MSIENTCETPGEGPMTIDAGLERLNEVSTLTSIQVDMQERISQMERGFNYEIGGSDSGEYIIRVSRFTEGCNIAHALIRLPPDIIKVNEINTLVLRLFELRKENGLGTLRDITQSSESGAFRSIIYEPNDQKITSMAMGWFRGRNNNINLPNWAQHQNYFTDIFNFLSQINNPL